MMSQLNISFKNSPIILNYLRDMDSGRIWDYIKLGKTKARNLVVNVISHDEKLRVAEILKNIFFTICIDETTDITHDKSLIIIVRYPDPNDGRVKSYVWEILSVFSDGELAKAGSEQIINCVKKSFDAHKIPLKNIFAYFTDGCTTMVGNISGVKARFQSLVPGIIDVSCVAHITHNCAKHALKNIPSYIDALFIDLFTLLQSCNKAKNFRNLQEKLDITKHKILRLVITRWLSLEEVLERDLEQ